MWPCLSQCRCVIGTRYWDVDVVDGVVFGVAITPKFDFVSFRDDNDWDNPKFDFVSFRDDNDWDNDWDIKLVIDIAFLDFASTAVVVRLLLIDDDNNEGGANCNSGCNCDCNCEEEEEEGARESLDNEVEILLFLDVSWNVSVSEKILLL